MATPRPDPTEVELDRTLPPNDGPAAGQLIGRYRLERLLGEGGMGTVWLAHDTALDRPVALKIPRADHPELTARFLREARAAAGLQHPNICPIYDVGQVGDTCFLCMAYVRGEPLSARVGAGRSLDPAEAARLVCVIARAMQYAHSQGVIHRDLKPANVLIDERGQPIVMDFGLARRQCDVAGQLTAQGAVLGTPAYMSPEQIAGDGDRIGPASDTYSLGVLLYELLTGAPPFSGDLIALLAQVPLDPVVPPSSRRPGLDKRFDAVCLKALAKRPEDRWSSMQRFADALTVLGGATEKESVDGPGLTLRVLGTAFAYRPPPGLALVTVGRQRRKLGDPPDQGNDFVLRVAGNDALSARISRRHFEIHRTPSGYAVVDRSKIGTSRNGVPLPKDTPMPLADGDRLEVAGVIALEVVIRAQALGGVAVRPGVVVQVPAVASGGRVEIEASLGEMVTVDQ